MEVTVNMERAQLVVSRVNDAFLQRAGILAETDDLVESQIPDGVEPLSREHACFLFYVVANDHGMKSSRLYAKAKRVYLESPALFDPFKVLELFNGPEDPKLVEATAVQLGVRYPRECARTWFSNSVKLVENYDGDPRNLFNSTSQAEELLRRIIRFRGYGPKIGGMLLRAVVGLGFAELMGLEKVLVPVDIHDARISFYTEILKLPYQEENIDYYKYVPLVQQILRDACNSSKLNWLNVDRGLWLIGSRGCVHKRCYSCPLHDICLIGINVVRSRLFQ